MKIKGKIFNNQYGMVSITVTVVFIVVISLVVLGFSQVSRRNSRETLDRQLSSQAFYAAETGARDVQNKIAGMIDRGEEIVAQTECEDTEKYTRQEGRVGDKSDSVYTCLLVDPTPKTLDYSNVGSGTSIVVPLNSTSGALNQNEIVWKRSAANKPENKINNCPSIKGGTQWTNFPKSTDWKCPFGVIRIELMPVNSTTLSSADAAGNNSMVLFAYPQQGNIADPTLVTYNINDLRSNQGRVIAAKCNDDECRIKINGLSFSNAYMRVRTMYADTSNFQVRADGFNASVDGPNSDSEVTTGNSFKNGQVVIDVTAKSQDVLRRIQVRGSLTGGTSRTDSGSFSDFAIRSNDSICKRFEVAPATLSRPPYFAHVDAQGSECN
jgi:Tfp pilus assembly protein PilX